MPASLRSAAVLILLASGNAAALPDLTPEVDSVQIQTNQSVGSGDVVEGCAGATSGRTLLRFGVRFWNVGDESLVIGPANCPDCATHPNAVCGDPRFICSPADGHNHPHYDRFARYQLYDAPGTTLLAEGHKVSFCVRETSCPQGVPLTFTCENQGIQPGCYDHYVSSLGCQYIDVTGVPRVTKRALRLRVLLDPDGTLPDASRANNVLEHLIAGCGDGVVQAGEECDGGGCCGARCRFAGLECRCTALIDEAASCADGPARRVRRRVQRIVRLLANAGEPGVAARLRTTTERLRAFTARVGCVASSAAALHRHVRRHLRAIAAQSNTPP